MSIEKRRGSKGWCWELVVRIPLWWRAYGKRTAAKAQVEHAATPPTESA